MGARVRRNHPRTTLRQWKAFEACVIEGLKQADAGKRFGVTRSAIAQRIRRYRQAMSFTRATPKGRRPHKVKVLSLSFLENT
jgi:transposase